MLNREGWSLLAILVLLLAHLGAGFAQLGRERTLEERLRPGGGAADTALGLAQAGAGALLLAAVPGALYTGGLARLLLPLSLLLGVWALLLVLRPRLVPPQGPARAAFAGAAALQALLLSAASIALLGRVIAGVFSLHTTLALLSAAALSALLALLCGPLARRRMDRLQTALLAALLAGLPLCSALLGERAETMAQWLNEALSLIYTNDYAPALANLEIVRSMAKSLPDNYSLKLENIF